MKTLVKAHIKKYSVGKKEILKEINFALHSNEIVAIIGKNGAGKSSLFKHLTSEIKNADADIIFLDKQIKDYSLNELALKRSVLEQNNELNFDFTVKEVVALGRNPHSSFESKEDVKEVVEKLLKQLDLFELKDQYYLSLSGGEKQRVHLARVFCQLYPHLENKIFLLDEPDNFLDIGHIHKLMNLLKEFKTKGAGILIVLHDLNLVSVYADRIYLLDQGEVLISGTNKEVLTKENIKRAFDHDVIISEHPEKGCPLIITV